MTLFSALVKTTINLATLPIAIVKDVITLGNAANSDEKTYTEQKLDEIKKDSEE